MNRPRLNPADVGKHVTRLKYAWIDEQMQKHLPTELYRQAHTDRSGNAQAKVRELGYNVVFDGDVVIFKKGEDILAQRQFLLELKDGEDLIQLAKSCKLRIGSP